MCDCAMECGFVAVFDGGILSPSEGGDPSVVWTAGENPPKKKLFQVNYDEHIFSKSNGEKRAFRCFPCGIIIMTEVEDHSLRQPVGNVDRILVAANDNDVSADDIGPDDTTQPSPCLQCGAEIPIGCDSCSECGWSYRQDESS